MRAGGLNCVGVMRADRIPPPGGVMLAARAFFVCGWAVVFTAIAPPARAEDPAIAEARTRLYTARDKAIALLEDAVRRRPDDPKLWAEHVHALDVDEFDGIADLAVRHALKAHPR